MLDVAAFTGGRTVPSARFRVRQYRDALFKCGVCLQEFAATFGSYPPERRLLRPLWGAAALADGALRAARSHRYDLSLLQREFLSTLVTCERLAKRPRILDVDDAVFLFRDGRTARRLATLCDRIICGNAFLANWFERWNSSVVVIPTAIDTAAYFPGSSDSGSGPVLGWIGTYANLKFLTQVEPALRKVLAALPTARLRVVSDKAPSLPSISRDRIEFVRWTEAGEAAAIRSMTLGIMPLEDSAWARGKCSFKMLQYMACGLPVVVSPVGMNAEVLALGNCGVGATDLKDWEDALIGILKDEVMRRSMGMEGRRIVESHFSVNVVAPQLAHCFRGDSRPPAP
jgi:glycosyltransferase involved in cell wall biosynthesis